MVVLGLWRAREVWAGGWCGEEWFGVYGSFCFWRVGILKGRLFDDRPFGFCVGCLGCLVA